MTSTPHTATPGWNLAEIWERNADRFPDATAQIQGDRTFTWAEFDQRADGVAAALLAGGAQHQDKVAHYLYNCPEYLESMFAMFKAGLVPVNTNYRYTDDELAYLWDNSDAVAVVFHASFTDRCAAMRARVPRVRTWICVDDGTGPCPDWAVPYETAAASATGRTVAPWGRSPDDLYILCSDGLSGMVKDSEMEQAILAWEGDPTKSEDVDSLCHTLVNAANRNGGTDNVTTVIIKVVS